ncbi:GGDEF domain-containing protein [Aliihoeflea sp. PC F10.4]
MRFHQTELAFFVFITVVIAASVTAFHAYGVIQSLSGSVVDVLPVSYLARLLFAISVLLAMAIFFGAFFIYPLIRQQVQEHGKLRAMTEKLSARSETLEHAALTDGLTGMQNRRFFDEALREYLAAFGPIERPVGLMIIDLDYFKSVNDTHGHDIGDKVLKEVARCLRELTRYHDVVARIGGEEFAILAADMDDARLIAFAERVRKAISSLAVVNGNVRLKVTASLGLAVWDGTEKGDALYRRADKRLYQAKGLGRNRVCA